MANFKFFKEVGDKLVLDANYMEIYLPEEYFTNKIASTMGTSVRTLGIFHFGIYASDVIKEGDGKIYSLNLPLFISLNLKDMYKTKKKLKKELQTTDYNVLTYHKGDVIIEELNLIQDSEAVAKFINLLHSGKLPSDIPYDKVISLYHDTLAFNGVDIGVPSFVLEIIIADLYRNRRDISKPFRLEAGKGKASMYDYETVNIKAIPALNSTFTAISFENMDQSIIASINRSRENIPELVSPVEKTIKY